MHDGARLSEALEKIQPLPYPERHVFRCVELEALIGDGTRPVQPLYDLGPGKSGQRYTPPGGARALYVAEHPYTSYLEATGMFDSVTDLAAQQTNTQTTLQFQVRLEAMLDLTVADNMADLGTDRDELLASWEWQMAKGARIPTQDLGQAAFDCGRFQAIRFWSTKHDKHANLCIWTERIVAPAVVACTDAKFPQRIP
jgi:RES domain-containing protein